MAVMHWAAAASQCRRSAAVLHAGLSWIGSGFGSATVLMTGVRLQEQCCISPSMWNRYATDYSLSSSIYSIDTTFVCDKVNNCFEQQATFVQLCSAANTSYVLSVPRSYAVAWQHVVLLCEDSTTDSCMEANSAQYCIAECIALSPAPSPAPGSDPNTLSPPALPVPDSTDLGEAEVRTIVLATVVPAGM